ncbi:hypothetical protein NKH45_26855, partial [Mesorhizobium sp. M1156]
IKNLTPAPRCSGPHGRRIHVCGLHRMGTWYLLITSVLNVAQGAIERHYSRGDRGAREKTATATLEAANERA